MADKDQTYAITDFLNDAAAPYALQLEIEADVGITTALAAGGILNRGNDTPGECDIHFVSDISAGEKTALDLLVGLHDGVEVFMDPDLDLQMAGQINALDVKTPPVSGDMLMIEDSADSYNKKGIDCDEFATASHTHAAAIHDDVAGEINAIATKPTCVFADVVLIEDSENGFVKKKVEVSELAAYDAVAFHSNESGEVSSLTAKGTPTTADHLVIEDAAASDAKKRITIGDLPAAAPASHTHLQADVTDLDHTDADAIHDNASGEISAVAEKVTPAENDLVLIEDSAASNVKKRVKLVNLPVPDHLHLEADVTDLDHTDADAIHDNVNGEISTVTEKATPIAADLVLIEDSAASNAKKRVQVGNLPVPDHSTHPTIDVTGKAGFDKQEQLAKSGAVTFDLTAGNRHYMEITGNITVTVTNPFTSGQDKMSSGTMVIKQKGSGSYTATWSLGSDQTFGRTAGTPVAKPALYTAVDSKTLVHWNWDGDELHLRRDSEA